MLLDACFAGQTGKRRLADPHASVLVAPADPPPGIGSAPHDVLTASGADEVANWDDADKHGLFTEYFCARSTGLPTRRNTAARATRTSPSAK